MSTHTFEGVSDDEATQQAVNEAIDGAIEELEQAPGACVTIEEISHDD